MIRFILLFSILFITSCKEDILNDKNTIIGDSFYKKGETLFKKNDVEAYDNFQKAILNYKLGKDSVNISNALIYQANIQVNKGDYLGAEETLVEALDLLKDGDESFYSLYGTMANIKSNQKDYLSSIEWCNKALAEKIDYSIKANLLNNKAVFLSKIKKYDEALMILNTIEFDSINKDTFKNTINDNKEFVKWHIKNDHLSEGNLEKILLLRIKDDDMWGMNSSYSHLATINEIKDPEKSLFYAKKMLDVALTIKSPLDRLEALEKILVVGDFLDYKKNFKEYKKLSDSIQESSYNYSKSFAFIKYDSNKKNAENQKLKLDTVENKNQILKQYFGLASLSFLLIGGFFWYKKRRKRLQQEKQLEVKNTELKYSKKVHDVVANGLYHMMIDVQNNPEINKVKILNDMEKMYEESRDIANENTVEIDFSSRFSNMISSYSSPEQKVLIAGYTESIWENISHNIQLELYYILRELLVNMKKHSQAKLASLKFEKEKDTLKIKYTDNGVGIKNLTNQKGTGIQNMENRIETIGANITFENKTNGGLIVQITIPINLKYV